MARVTTILEANAFLQEYIAEFKKAFSLVKGHFKSVFDDVLSEEEINLHLATFSKRKIDSGHSIKFKTAITL